MDILIKHQVTLKLYVDDIDFFMFLTEKAKEAKNLTKKENESIFEFSKILKQLKEASKIPENFIEIKS